MHRCMLEIYLTAGYAINVKMHWLRTSNVVLVN